MVFCSIRFAFAATSSYKNKIRPFVSHLKLWIKNFYLLTWRDLCDLVNNSNDCNFSSNSPLNVKGQRPLRLKPYGDQRHRKWQFRRQRISSKPHAGIWRNFSSLPHHMTIVIPFLYQAFRICNTAYSILKVELCSPYYVQVKLLLWNAYH